MGKPGKKHHNRDVTVCSKGKYSYNEFFNFDHYDEDDEQDSSMLCRHLFTPKPKLITALPCANTNGNKRTKTTNASNGKKWSDTMKPRNPNQAKYIELLEKPMPYIVVASGGAGVGKTSIAVSVAVQQLLNHTYEKIVITRPMVTVEEEMGFLPGSLEDKMDPWLRPLYDTFYKYYTPDQVKLMIANKTIDICPIAFLRGRTLENSFIILDEAQNCSVTQMLMVLTRIGENSKMVIAGDPMQHDRGREASGLSDLIHKLNYRDSVEIDIIANKEKSIHHVAFSDQDVERHPVIKDILKLYR